MAGFSNKSRCDLSEVFSQLERADAPTLRNAQIELSRLLQDKTRQESAESETVDAPSSRPYHG